MAESSTRKVRLRAEVDGEDRRSLWASLNAEGSLLIEGQDLGPGTAVVSSDGEYEWARTFRAEQIPALVALLGAGPGDAILDVLERDWTGQRSYELERRIRESAIPNEVWTWNG